MSDDATKYRTSDGSVLTAAEIVRLDEIEARLGDSDEIPETPDEAWASAVRGKHTRAAPVPVRLDPDVLAWLRLQGPSRSDAINRILRERMAAESVT